MRGKHLPPDTVRYEPPSVELLVTFDALHQLQVMPLCKFHGLPHLLHILSTSL